MGIDAGRLVNENQDWAICSICKDVLLDIKVLECDHYFCGSCILQWSNTKSNCPECRVTIRTGNFKSASLFMKRQFDQVKIKCKFENCKTVIAYDNILVWDT